MTLRVRPLAALAAALLYFSAHGAELDERAQSGWEELRVLDPNSARDFFKTAIKKDPASREARYGEALALLNAQPRSESNITNARRLFEALQTGNPGDDTGIGAAYYLARIRQIHDYHPDIPGAIEAYRALLQSHPGHPVAELAAPKLAILLLYADVAPEIWEQHVDEILALLPRLRSPDARRDTRLVLADALLRLRRDHARAYPLITYCLEAGLIVRTPRLNAMLLQAAESARLLGRRDEAITYYTRYLENFPYDVKSPAVRERLAALQRKETP